MERVTGGWERTVAAVAAGVAALVAVPTAVAVGLFLLLSSVTLDGCDEISLSPTAAGVSALPEGGVAIHPGPCRNSMGVGSVRVRAGDGTVVWQADSADLGTSEAGAPLTVDRIVVGEAPPGFADVVPLAAPLDPAASYTVELSPLDPSTAPDTGAPSGGADALYTALGQTATFSPAGLAPGTVSYGGDRLGPAEFADAGCEDAGGD